MFSQATLLTTAVTTTGQKLTSGLENLDSNPGLSLGTHNPTKPTTLTAKCGDWSRLPDALGESVGWPQWDSAHGEGFREPRLEGKGPRRCNQSRSIKKALPNAALNYFLMDYELSLSTLARHAALGRCGGVRERKWEAQLLTAGCGQWQAHKASWQQLKKGTSTTF